jgi:hypothetical protein
MADKHSKTQLLVLGGGPGGYPAAFLAARQKPNDADELPRTLLKERIEEARILQRLPKDLAALFDAAEVEWNPGDGRPPSAIL